MHIVDRAWPGAVGVDAAELAELEFFAGSSIGALAPLAGLLSPLRAAAGAVLMRQREPADWFLLVGSGSGEVIHAGNGGSSVVAHLVPGTVVGEIALLRGTARTATVVATEQVQGWSGGRDAFATMLEIPGVSESLVWTARQRLATFVTPIPVRLRDGAEFYLRPILPGDSQRLARLSPRTVYRRFMGVPGKRMITYLFEVDYLEHFAWALTDEPDGLVVADARFIRHTDEPDSAELAFTVGDDYQGRGIGTLLMEALSVSAHAGGVRRFTASVLAENHAMRSILNRYGARWESDGPGVVTTILDVPRTRDLNLSPRVSIQIDVATRQMVQALC
ncbi:GNAT family N-acetyltransferase [Mycobacteroides abscessus]|uniref:GNAT family N-acetyltransferase n=1 Tax=Mycobacteroides abscessus TaxID=36809 RepID=A0ABD7HUH0_9MYCO|nr:GNAT family N-acetyltransferase [Mycobacteroides abscessus]PVA78246.1 GNAT family N-acetyltransferase [Mycobacteroides abscessus]PVB19790.1 GNAT family N-acetyltransferase [Mycobacteroides abscessus]PVB24490.1 GNAT family N-acetyltransferase [Mycobacteroides abscessus]PVB27220.1 GNAT family N-acetyltransferase [Mycobacteroides abscessus]